MANNTKITLAVNLAVVLALTISCSSSDDDNLSGGKGNDIANYRTVVIGEQTWMAENLNYAIKGSKCYDNSESNCDIYGRLYDWPTAMTICPSGWHLPTHDEWNALTKYIESVNSCSSCDAKHLKAENYWNQNGNGEDTHEFSALPGGRGYSNGSFYNIGNYGYWWSASEIWYDSKLVSIRNMHYNSEDAGWGNGGKFFLFSVRCVRD